MRLNRRLRNSLLLALGLFSFGAAIYLAIGYVRGGEAEPPETQTQADGFSVRQHAEGRDQTVVEQASVIKYDVDPDLPRIITIPKLDIEARLMPMGRNLDNSMQAPFNIFDAGWYTGSARPGDPGAVVVDGHASGPTRQGLFAYLDTLRIGDYIQIERGDGRIFKYIVQVVETVNLTTIDMAKIMRPYDGSGEGLNLITCAGTWLADQETYNQRVIVYATRSQ